MSIGKFIIFILFLSHLALAEGVPFKVSSAALAPTSTTLGQSTDSGDPESNLINDLKYLAVSNWLQSYLGPRFTQFDKYVTPEFAEKYILDYKVARTGNAAGVLELIGHLDGDALKRWVRLNESKAKASNQIRPLLIVSSNIPGLNLSPSETSLRQKDSAIAQLLSHLTQLQFKRLNSQPTFLDSSIGLEMPPKNSSEIQSLTSSANRKGDTLVVWETLSVCAGSSNPRLDIMVYNTQNQNLAFVVGDDLPISVRDLNNTELVKKSIVPIFQQFQSELENTFSEGLLQEFSLRLIVENVNSYRALKALEAGLSQGNGISSPVLKKVTGRSVEYELKSSLSIDALGIRIQETSIPGSKTQVTRSDNSTLVVKFTK